MIKKEETKVGLIPGLLGLTVLGAFLVGWVLNLVTLFSMSWTSDVIGMLIVRTVGVFVPFIGGVVGYI